MLHYTWERGHLLEFAMGNPTRMVKLPLTHGGITQSPLGSHVCATKLDMLKHTIPRMEHAPLKEGRKWESWSGISHPHLTHTRVLPPPASMYGMHNQVKFLKLQPH